MMRVQRWVLSMVCVVAVALAADVGSVEASDGSARVTREQLLRAEPDAIAATMAPWIKEGDRIAAVLIERAQDTSRTELDRRAATLELRRVPTPRAVAHCVRHVDWRIDAAALEMREDLGPYAERPCMSVLVTLGYRALPEILSTLQSGGGLPESTHLGIAEALEVVCGLDIAKAVIAAEVDRLGDLASPDLRAVRSRLETGK